MDREIMTTLRAPLQSPTNRLEKDIVRTLLEKLAEVPAEYPPELYAPRREAYLHQITTKADRIAVRSAGS